MASRMIRHRAVHQSNGMTLRELEEFCSDMRSAGAVGDSIPRFLNKIGFNSDGMPAKSVVWDQDDERKTFSG